MLIGEVGISPDEFWKLTEGETIAKVRGYYFRKDYETDNFRSLYTLTHNLNVKKGHQKTKTQLWPLMIDQREIKTLTHEQIVERNRRIREAGK